jgi:hypothetical protein
MVIILIVLLIARPVLWAILRVLLAGIGIVLYLVVQSIRGEIEDYRTREELREALEHQD